MLKALAFDQSIAKPVKVKHILEQRICCIVAMYFNTITAKFSEAPINF